MRIPPTSGVTWRASKRKFEEMAVELRMTVEEPDDFGTRFFDRAFEEKRRSVV